jgi:hypothetical protein
MISAIAGDIVGSRFVQKMEIKLWYMVHCKSAVCLSFKGL